MCDNDQRHAAVCQILHNIQHLSHHLGIQRGGGFVKQDDLGVHGKGTGDGYTLALSAGKRGGEHMRLIRESHAGQQFHGGSFRRAGRSTSNLAGSDAHIVQHRNVREQIEALKHHAHLCTDGVLRLGRQHGTVYNDLTLRRHLQIVQTPQESALAGAGGADDADYLVFPDSLVDTLEYFQRAKILF